MHAMLHTDCLVNVLRETVLLCMYCVRACMRACALTECLSHVLVESDGVGVFKELSHHLSLFILHHQHLLRLGHA